MQTTTIFKGKWWLPEKPEDKVSGVLTYIPGETITLELIGNFQDSAQDAFSLMFQNERVPVIYGQASDVLTYPCSIVVVIFIGRTKLIFLLPNTRREQLPSEFILPI